MFSIISEFESVSNACTDVREFCKGNGIPDLHCNEFEICLTEALNNVIKHSYKEDSSKKIDILVTYEDSTVNIHIIDTGIARADLSERSLEFDPSDIENLPEGGMGLFIIEQLMDKTEYFSVDGSNTFIMTKKLK
ncbi:MAG: ATP-binding protein [Melioribacteraceae bacterium]|nr:ATP-binding protein [Melioribacteraceae bacterium]MCF8353369.1 ATP-binding protein [Melioribacteraceae bacterium]MCF8393052.1 ATP-binding protein [Melioribacteraceae bacterium]